MIGELVVNGELEIENSNGVTYWMQYAEMVVSYDTDDATWELIEVQVEAYTNGKADKTFRITEQSTDLLDKYIWHAAKEHCEIWAEPRVRAACDEYEVDRAARKADHYREQMKCQF